MFCCNSRDGEPASFMGLSFGSRSYARTLGLVHGETTPTIVKTPLDQAADIDPTKVLVSVEFAALTIKDRDDIKAASSITSPGLKEGEKSSKPKLGHDFSGIVKKAGEKSGFSKGDEVYGWVASGAFSDVIEVSATQVAKVPKGVSLEAAAALPYSAYVAHKALKELKKDQKVHINAKGYLADFLKAIAGKETPHVTVYTEEVVEVKEGKHDFYIEALNKKSEHKFESGFGLSDLTGNGLTPLRYELKGEDFGTIKEFVETHQGVIGPIKVQKTHLIEPSTFEKGFPDALKQISEGHTGPFVFQVDGLLDKISKAEAEAASKAAKEASEKAEKEAKAAKEAQAKAEKEAKEAGKDASKDASKDAKEGEADAKKDEEGVFTKTTGAIGGFFGSIGSGIGSIFGGAKKDEAEASKDVKKEETEVKTETKTETTEVKTEVKTETK